MALTLEALQSKARVRLGFTKSDVDDGTLTECIEGALEEFGEYKPLEQYGQFAVNGSDQDYPFPAGVKKVRDVLFTPSTLFTAFTGDPDLALFVQAQMLGVHFGNLGGNPFENPSLGLIFWSKLKSLGTSFGSGFQILNTDPPAIRLTPPPNEVGTAWYRGEKAYSLDKVPDAYREAFIKAMLWKVSEWRGNNLAVAVKWSQAGGVQVSPAFEYWVKQADNYRKQFIADVGGQAAIVRFG